MKKNYRIQIREKKYGAKKHVISDNNSYEKKTTFDNLSIKDTNLLNGKVKMLEEDKKKQKSNYA